MDENKFSVFPEKDYGSVTDEQREYLKKTDRLIWTASGVAIAVMLAMLLLQIVLYM